MKFIVPVFLFLSLCTCKLHAQVPEPDSTVIWVIKTTTGSTYEGYITEMKSLSVTLKTTGGVTITLSREIIDEMYRKATNRQIVTRQRRTVNRYNLSSSAYSIGKNNGYYRNNTVSINEVAYGVGNHFDLELSTTILFSPLFLKGKYSIPLVENQLTASLTAGAVVIPYIIDGTTAGAAYTFGGKLTVGPRHRNLSFGYSTFGGSPFENALNVYNVSGKIDLSYKFSLVGDVVWFSEPTNRANTFAIDQNNETLAFASIGPRWRMSNLSFDVNATFLIFDATLIAFPTANILVPF